MAHESHYNEFPMQGFEHSHEFFGIQPGMEILGVPSKHQSWQAAASVSPWQVDNSSSSSSSSLRPLFSCVRTQRPSGGPSLSLLNMKHSAALVGVPQPPEQYSAAGDKPQLRAAYHLQQQQLRNSKFLGPAQELLNEFCGLTGQSSSKKKPNKTNHEGEAGKPSLSSPWHQSLRSMDLVELQKIKAQLLSMLEEVDMRYRKYYEEMRGVVAWFEVVGGEGAASAYAGLASKAMSRHFRCLRDGIVGQIHAVKEATGEKDSAAPGTTPGETPRLRMLDQRNRRQKAFQQGTMKPHPWRPQRGLPDRSVSVLRAWLFEHFLHPYPNDADKHILARQTGLSRGQVSNWFINARVRLWKPMVEEMYLEETNELENQADQAPTGHEHNDHPNPNPNSGLSFDQKPLPVQPLVDSESLSSIINSSHHSDQTLHQYRQQHHRHVSDLGFPYSSSSSSTGVSLTLGLQHHSGGGMSLSLLHDSQLFSADHVDDDQQVHFSISDGEAVNLPYRDLMGAQLLQDMTR
ncbi:homeobox protein BEL1 homolog [Musa acuminata AAA Group]|uniref:homeobox protein BEL1 homolog n=1 Tax=Musa acuminata AAA Group TaxID=214697 RepID=UPI0031E2B080